MSTSVVVTVHQSGALFTGRATEILQHALREAQTAVGDRGVDLVKKRLGETLVNPTGFYESQIGTDWVDADLSVNDNDVIYGPWLEGVGSRNYPVTRFRGYSTFRLATQELQGMLPELVDPPIARAVSEINS